MREKYFSCQSMIVGIFALVITLNVANPQIALSQSFSFQKWLFGQPSTLSLWIIDINKHTGEVNINGSDTQQPGIPFTWDWGDGTVHDGWFPQHHTYTNITENYIVKVIAHYGGSEEDSAKILVRFIRPAITPISLSQDIEVFIPNHEMNLTSRMPGYTIPENLTYFDDSFFNIIPRSTVEYILTVSASIQKEFVNENLFLIEGGFNQYLLRDFSFGGMYSLWFTSPVVFGVGNYGFQGNIEYSSFMHEMGHNFTLNTPAEYIYGGKIDGNANAIYSETMANIFAHSTAYELLNKYEFYGFEEDLAYEIEQSAISSIQITKDAYEHYIDSGKDFHSWNDPMTPDDETFNTFQTLAFKFCEHGETDGYGYREPLKRMLKLLQLFDEGLHDSYDQFNDNHDADTFRATLMIAALSYGFMSDLRAEFRALNFPIDDDMYSELYNRVRTTIELITPNGGENFFAGDIEDITWTSENTSGNVTIEYSVDGGSGWQTVIDSTPDDGSYSWKIPNTPSTNCIVRVCDAEQSQFCDESGTFTIVGCCQCADCNEDGSVNIIDALWEVNCVLGVTPPPCSCNCNQDETDNILDVLCIVNIILSGICP